MTTILMYHQIAELPRVVDPLGLSVPQDQFEQQMNYLARNRYVCLTLAEAVQYILHDEHAPARSFVLTFDDGYQDVLLKALPILKKFGFTATVFMVAGHMGMKSDWQGQDGDRAGQLMSQAEARELLQHGFIFGSHTLSHPFLHMLDERSVLEELRMSKALLQERLHERVDYFSYPYSRTNEHIEDLVRATGYRAACAGDTGPWSVHHLWRVPCRSDDSLSTFAMKASGWYDRRTALRESAPVEMLRRMTRMLRRGRGVSRPSETERIGGRS